MKRLLLRVIFRMAAIFVTSEVAGIPPHYKPTQLKGDGTVVLRPMESISLSFQIEGSALVRLKILPRDGDDAGGIYL